MRYLTEEEKAYCLANQTTALMKWIGKRLILENVDEATYLSEMAEAFPTLESEYKSLLKHEVMPVLALQDFQITEEEADFSTFINKTPLASLKIETYGDYRLFLGSATNTKKDVAYITDYYLQIVDGKFYDRTVNRFETEDGEDETINSKLRFAIKLRIIYAYTDGDTVYVAYRIGRDKKDRISEISQAIDTIKALYHLSPKDCYNIKVYFDDVLPKFLTFDKPSDARIAVINDKIVVNYPEPFDEKATLEALINVYKVTTQKELMSFLMLYAPITPFNVQLRQKETIMYLPLILGKGGAGKSAMVKTVIVKGFANPDAEKSEDDIFTKASFRENFSKSIFPIMIDEITQPTMQRIYGSMKNLATGKGTHSRGRPTGGLNEWTLSAIPFFTSNETIYIDSGMERRFFKLIANDTDNNIQEWRKAKEKLPDGFLYMFMKEFNGMTIDELVSNIIKYVQHDEDYVFAYQMVVKGIMDKVFQKYGMKCPFEPLKKVVYDDDDWYVAFGQFVMQNLYDFKMGNMTYLKEGFDFDIDNNSNEVYISKLGFQKFLKLFPKCPFRNASSFAINAPDNNYVIAYKKKRVCHSKNPIHVISVTEKGEELQVKLPRTTTVSTDISILKQLNTKEHTQIAEITDT